MILNGSVTSGAVRTASKSSKWKHEVAERAGPIELLFDVAFVFALHQVSATMFANLTPVGALRSVLIIIAFWLLWAYTTWATDLLGPNRPGTKVIVVMVMLGISLIAAAVPNAFGSDGLVFAVLYVSIQISRTAYMAYVLRGQPITPKRTHMLAWFCITGVLWIAGGLVAVPIRTLVWGIAIVLTLGSSRYDFWLPWQGPAELGTTKISARHMAERYQQIIILALGEKILAAGLIFANYNFGLLRTTAFVVAFATTILLWRIYFHRAGSQMAETIAATRSKKGKLTLSMSYAYLIMFVGIMVSSVAEKIVIAQPSSPAGLLWVLIIVGGPAIFLIGRERLHFIRSGRLGRTRVIALAILAVMTPAMPSLASVAVSIAVNLVLGGVALSTIVPARLSPRQPTSPMMK